jgi:hypothetical protein
MRTISATAMPTIFRLIDGRNIQFMGPGLMVAEGWQPPECINPGHSANCDPRRCGAMTGDQQGK